MVADMEIKGNKEILTTAVETDSQVARVSEVEAAIIAAEIKEITAQTLDGKTITAAAIKEEDIREEVAVAVITEEEVEEEVNHTIEVAPHSIMAMEEEEEEEAEVVVTMIAEADTERRKMRWDSMVTIAQTLKWSKSCSTLMKCRLLALTSTK